MEYDTLSEDSTEFSTAPIFVDIWREGRRRQVTPGLGVRVFVIFD